MTRILRLFAVCALLFVPVVVTPADADTGHRVDFVKAARLLNAWQFDEAKKLIADIARERPDASTTRYLQAELAFLEGDYGRALALLEEIEDDDSGNVAALRTLVASTHATTDSFASKQSSGGHFVILYPPGKDEVIVDLAGDVLEAAYEALADDLGFRPDRVIRVELLSRPADLARVSTLTEGEIETTGTIALCKYNKLMVVTPRATLFGYPWMDTLVHEYVHYAVSSLSHDQVPVWLHEGLAKFEQVRWRKQADARLSSSDEHLLATALRKNELITFDAMHPSMAKLPSQSAAALAFAEVFTMIAYIHERVGYEGIRAIIADQKGGTDARTAVANALGKSWPAVEQDWQNYLRRSNLKSSQELDAVAGRRIRFRKGDGRDSENVGLDRVASEKARNYTRLGGILRARGMTEAATVEYEKALAIVGEREPFVAGKLSRAYLELGRHERAIELAGPLAEADEADAAPATTLGLAHLAAGNADSARDALERALRITPFDPAVRCGLAEAYSTLGESSKKAREQAACERLRR